MRQVNLIKIIDIGC